MTLCIVKPKSFSKKCKNFFLLGKLILTIKLEELRAIIGLKMCEGIGDISAYKLISHCGSAEAVLKEKRQHLSSIPGIHSNIPEFLAHINWSSVDKEVDFIERNCLN